jgi:twitching motility protein PilT
VDVFPEKEQETARSILGGNLAGIVSQQLLRTKSGKGRVASLEVLFNTSGIANLIREGKTPMITSAIQSAGSEGMIPMEKSLADLVNSGKVTQEAAFQKAADKDYFTKMCKK